MITRVVFGNGFELDNVEEVREVVQDNGDYIYRGLALNILSEDVSLAISNISSKLSEDKALSKIQIYKKDKVDVSVNEETGEVITEYGDEYLSFESSDFVGLKSIYGDINTGLITLSLNTDHTKLADEKYNELVNENASLKAQNETLSQAVAELTAIISSMLMS